MTLADSALSANAPHGPTPEAAVEEFPRLADGVELIGEYEGSGYKVPPSLVRRADGQVLQLPPLLYRLAADADGRHTLDEIATQVSREIQRGLDADQVKFLVDEKLRPMGVLAGADGSSPSTEKADPFLALRFRAAVISERTSDVLGAIFKPLFLPPIVFLALLTFVAGDVWLFGVHGVAQALRQSIDNPGLFLPLLFAVILAAAFHEIGHAAACRYGGGHPGKMGCGLYLAFPAFYTDVTDAYRLGRRARLRTDVGGVYFNVVVILATMGAYALTGFEPLLLLVIIQHIEIVHQLLPVIRLDGYYIVSDITGVPDLFARIGPILHSLNPFRPTDERVTTLKQWVRVAVTAWVFVVVPLLAFELLVVLIHLPRMIGTGWASGTKLYRDADHAFSKGNVVGGISDALQVIVLIIPLAGIGLMLITTARKLAVGLWTKTRGRPTLRSVGLLASGLALVVLALAWIPSHNYRAIQPGERGTFAETAAAVRRLPSGDAPLHTAVLAQHRARTSPAPGTTPTTSPSTSTTVPTTSTTARGFTHASVPPVPVTSGSSPGNPSSPPITATNPTATTTASTAPATPAAATPTTTAP